MNLSEHLQKLRGLVEVERGPGYTVLAKNQHAKEGTVIFDGLERERQARRVNGKWGRVGSNIQYGSKTLPGHEGDRVFYPFDGSGATPLD